MPGLGFVLGGVLTEMVEPRASFLVGRRGVVAVVAAAVPFLGGMNWGARPAPRGPDGSAANRSSGRARRGRRVIGAPQDLGARVELEVMAPVNRPFPRFIAESPHELEPHGRWRTTLEDLSAPRADRSRGTRSWESGRDRLVPGPDLRDQNVRPRPGLDGGRSRGFRLRIVHPPAESPQPADFVARADYAVETAADNPDWKLDLNDEVIAPWRGPAGATGELTLVWGTPLVPGAVAGTAEIENETLDQCALDQHKRFTLVALDAVTGFGDDLYLEIKLWNKRGDLLASETLYERGRKEEDEEEPEHG